MGNTQIHEVACPTLNRNYIDNRVRQLDLERKPANDVRSPGLTIQLVMDGGNRTRVICPHYQTAHGTCDLLKKQCDYHAVPISS